jgi:hypothetical protein
MTLIQSVLCGSGTGSFTAGGGGSASATGSFSSNTTAGNLLVLIAYYNQAVTSGSGFAPANFSVTGVSWGTVQASGGYDAAPHRSSSGIFFVGNAASVLSSAVTTATITANPSSANGTLAIEFAMFEFSGIAASASQVTGGALVDTKNTKGSQTSSVPDQGTITTSKTDLIITWFIGNSGNDSAGAGYTLGPNMLVATTGQMQYQLNVPAGSAATAFSGSQSNWGGGAMSFKAPASTPGRSYGFFFGD